MNFDSRTFDVGNVYKDDPDKLHSDLVGINGVSLEAVEAANEAADNDLDIINTEEASSLKVDYSLKIWKTSKLCLRFEKFSTLE